MHMQIKVLWSNVYSYFTRRDKIRKWQIIIVLQNCAYREDGYRTYHITEVKHS